MVSFGGAKSVTPSSSLKMRNCQKKLERIYVYTIAFTQIRDGGADLPPPTLDRVNKKNAVVVEEGFPNHTNRPNGNVDS